MRRLTIVVVLVALFDGCAGERKAGPAPSLGPPRTARERAAWQASQGLQIRVEEGRVDVAREDRVPVAEAEKLSEAEARALLRRLRPFEAAVPKKLALRAGSLPAPRAGATVQDPFPPPEKPAPPDPAQAGPLKVLRFSPEGEVDLAPNLSVTFSQPMVPVTAHAETIARGVPVRITPEPKGTWRWVGTKTLLFEPDPRFAMATSYRVEVPAGTKSIVGGRLETAVSWTFATPPLRLVSLYPTGGPHRLDPVFFASFNQAIDPDAVLRVTEVRGGGRTFALARARDEDVEGDPTVKSYARGTQKGRWVAFRATEVLPPDTTFTISIGPGAPSAEGPRKTTEVLSGSFRTYAPLRVEGQSCPEHRPCRPLAPLFLRFNNPLDEMAFDPAKIRVDPPLPGMRAEVRWGRLTIRGATQGRRTYKVTLPATLLDSFGQALGREETLTFHVGRARPILFAPGGPHVVLDPTGDRRFSVYSVNHEELDLRIHTVGPGDWKAWLEFAARGMQEKEPRDPPGTAVVRRTIRVGGKEDELTETRIELTEALAGGHGQVVVLVTQKPLAEKPWERRYAHAWVQVTNLAVDAFIDDERILAWVTRLSDGAPVAGARVTLHPDGTTATSDARGLATLDLPAKAGDVARILEAAAGGDRVLLPESEYPWKSGSSWHRTERGDAMRWFVFDDRKVYRPKEEVRVKGWARVVGFGREGGLRALPESVRTVSYVVRDPRGNKIAEGSAPVGTLGGFDFAFAIPDNANLGHARLTLTAPGAGVAGSTYDHTFQIQEFRRPEFEVRSSVSEGPHFVGGIAQVSATALYYAGGGLPGADVTWRVTTSDGYFSPPNQHEFTFVGAQPSWWRRPSTESRTETLRGKTDASGSHFIRIHFDAVRPPRPMSVRAEATILDVNRQAWSTSSVLVVHPARTYVGLRTPRAFVQKGKPLVVEAIVADLDGKRIAGSAIAMRAARSEWRRERGEWKEVEVDPQTCTVKSETQPVKCSFETREGGTYAIEATVHDPEGRPNRTVITRWVSGGKLPPKEKVEQEEVKLVADKASYEPGDTAEILVVSPFFPAEGLMTLRRAGVLATERFKLDGPTATLRVRIEEAHIPNLGVQVDVVGSAPRVDEEGKPIAGVPRRPAFAKGSISLSVPPLRRRLSVAVKARDEKIEPGGRTVVEVAIEDAAKRPVASSEVAVVVVDEAVLALTGYRVGDPLGTFYPYRALGVADFHLRPAVLLASPRELLERGARRGTREEAAAMAGAAPPPSPSPGRARTTMKARPEAARNGGETPIAVRADFRPLALFAPALRTGADGRARVELRVPDNLTRYRIFAVAVAEERFFGSGEATLTARLPLMVRPSAPRFLNFGDRFDLPVVVQNQTDEPMKVKVAVRGANLSFPKGTGKSLILPANDRREVRFPAATVLAGTARLQIAAAAGRFSDAAEISLPVWTPATTEAFATYGEIDRGAVVQPVKLPPDVFTEFGGIEVQTTSTALQALTDAVLYLVAYPFECSEQLASRILAVAALRDVLSAFEAKGLPPPATIVAAVGRDLQRLQGMQNDDGGFPLWVRGHPSWPFLSVHVTHALLRAKAKGFAVQEAMLSRALRHLEEIDRHIPADYSQPVRRAIRSYALYVRNVGGDADVAKAKALYAEIAGDKEPPLESVAWLYPVLSGKPGAEGEISAIRKLLQNRVTETASTAHFTTSYADGAHLLFHSDRRVDGLLLEALIVDQPRSDLIPKIVRGLLAHRKRGRWANTQESTWVLLALDKYFNTYEKVTPDFISRVWLGERYAGGHAFRGRTTERHQIDIPMSHLAEAKDADLVIAKEGPGRLYYRIGMRYAPRDLRPPPASHGFTVERRYEAVDDPRDVRRDRDGTWRVRAGSRVRVVVTLVAPTRRYHVALVDPLPAGLEPINVDLRGTESTPPPQTPPPTWGGRRGRVAHRVPWFLGWRRDWYEHQNLRDERAEAFSSLLWPGVHTFRYVARATTPGAFVVPPPKAEEMYAPETFGRGAGDRLLVE